MSGPRTVRAPRGAEISCKGWQQEAALRMLMNNLDPDVAERPDDLVVYGGSGKAVRTWDAFDAIVRELSALENDQTLLIQSGKPVGVLRTHPFAPRVLIANSLLVPDWATWETFWDLEEKGLTMYGQMTAGSWIYIGSQGILQGTYQTFASVAEKRFGGTLAGRVVLTAGLGGMGGAQPLAVTMNGGVALCIEIDPHRIQRRLDTGYLDTVADTLEDAIKLADEARVAGRALSIGLNDNAADIVPEIVEWGWPVDVATDQTSAHDPLNGYIPMGFTIEMAADLRAKNAQAYIRAARVSMARHCEALVALQRAGGEVFDYGNNLRGEALNGGFADAFAYPGFVPAYIRPLFSEGKGPFRWVALSGEPKDIAATDEAVLEAFPDDDSLQRWIRLAREKVHFQGLPARICWLGYGQRNVAGERFNDLVKTGTVSAPIVIGRDHLDAGSVASPYRETEAMRDGSDAIADWPVLNALVNASSGASWVSVHHGGGVGMGKSIHAGLVVVADGTDDGARRVELCLTNDPAMGVLRHADAGYERAIEVAGERGLRIPMRDEPS